MKIKDIVTSIFALISSVSLFAQAPDTMNVVIKDSVATYKDCSIKLRIARKDGLPFVFPSNYSIGREIDMTADLMMIIEKGREGKFSSYTCKYLSAHMDAEAGIPIKYKKYSRLVISDSLRDIVCLDSGQYRIRIDYNKRKTDGTLKLPDIVVSSNWAYFYVKNDEILLHEYWRGNKR